MRNLRLLGLLALAVLTLLSFAPLFSLATSLGTASIMHCRLDEAESYPCLIAGLNFGDVSHMAGMLLTCALWAFLMLRLRPRRVKKASYP